MTIERFKVERAFELAVGLQGGSVPGGFTEFYRTMVGDHKPIEAINEFDKIKWRGDSDMPTVKTMAAMIITDMYPDFFERISEDPDFLTETRELLKITGKTNIIRALVLLTGAKFYNDDRSTRRAFMIQADKLIDSSENTATSTIMAAMRISSMV